MLRVILEEEPRLVPAQSTGDRIRVPHHGKPSYTVAYATDECIWVGLLHGRAGERRLGVVGRDAGNKIPIPRGRNVLILRAVEVCVGQAVRKVEAIATNEG